MTEPLKSNQYIGNGFSAYGGDLTVLLTYDDDTIKDLAVTYHHESEMGQWAIEQLPGKIITANSADVDGITGATATSKAIKDATADALKKAQKESN